MDWLLHRLIGRGYQYQSKGSMFTGDLVLTQQSPSQIQFQSQSDQIRSQNLAGQWCLDKPLRGTAVVSCNCEAQKDIYSEYQAQVMAPQGATVVRQLVEDYPHNQTRYLPDRILYSNQLEVTGIEKRNPLQAQPQTCYLNSPASNIIVQTGSTLKGSIPNIIKSDPSDDPYLSFLPFSDSW